MLAVDKKSFPPSLSIDPRNKEEEGAAINGVCADRAMESKKRENIMGHSRTARCLCGHVFGLSLSLSLSLSSSRSLPLSWKVSLIVHYS